MGFSLMKVKRIVMTQQGNMGLLTPNIDNHKANTTHFSRDSEGIKGLTSSKDSMAKINGNKARTNNRITIKIKMAMSTIRKLTQTRQDKISRKHMRINKGELRRLLTTFSKMRIKTRGITRNITRRCLGESKKDKKKINNIGMSYEGSMMKGLVLMACSMINITQYNKLLASLELSSMP